jgi:hypothetical protein
MTFRQATVDDEELFWYWRNQNEQNGRAGGWWPHAFTTREQHCDWYLSRLGRITLLVWEPDGHPEGIVRVDSNGELAFDARDGLAAAMLEELRPLAEQYNGRLKAVVDIGNTAASRALHAAGFREHPVRFYTYRP